MGSARRFAASACALLITGLVVAPSAATASTTAERTPRQRLAHSAQATANAGSANLTGDVSVKAAGVNVDIKINGTSELGADAKNGQLTLDLGGLLGLQPLEVRIVNGDYYISLSAFAAVLPNLPAGKQWTRATAAEFQQVGSSGSDPAGQIGAFRGVRKVEVVGNEDIGGESTTHFRGVLNVAAALRATPRSQRARLRASLSALGSKNLHFDVWLDGKDRMRKFVLKFTIVRQGVTAEGTTTFELSDFGVKVNVQAPPADQVIPYSELKRLTSGTGR
jgi:hypothetical protein